MKKTLIATTLLALVCGTALAGGRDFHSHRSHHNVWNWVAPAVIGGFIVHEINRQPAYSPPPTFVYPSQPPMYMPPPVVIRETVQTQRMPAPFSSTRCTPWTETEHSDGSFSRTRTCSD